MCSLSISLKRQEASGKRPEKGKRAETHMGSPMAGWKRQQRQERGEEAEGGEGERRKEERAALCRWLREGLRPRPISSWGCPHARCVAPRGASAAEGGLERTMHAAAVPRVGATGGRAPPRHIVATLLALLAAVAVAVALAVARLSLALLALRRAVAMLLAVAPLALLATPPVPSPSSRSSKREKRDMGCDMYV